MLQRVEKFGGLIGFLVVEKPYHLLVRSMRDLWGPTASHASDRCYSLLGLSVCLEMQHTAMKLGNDGPWGSPGVGTSSSTNDRLLPEVRSDPRPLTTSTVCSICSIDWRCYRGSRNSAA